MKYIATHDKILDRAIGHLALLLERAHEPAAWPDSGLDLGERDGEEQAEALTDGFPDLDDLITWDVLVSTRS